MTDPILVTGGTGRLGRRLVPRLLAAGHVVRVLSRKPPRDGGLTMRRGDLITGEGLEEAVAGTGTIIHCATGNGHADQDATRALVRAAMRTGRPHLIYVSIVGVDRVDISYYRAKLACERLLEESGLPLTIQRTT
ncbi:SDR family oxidoreductase [Nonomuraea sp. CA-143628]|uniref:SDR family oxidoreductase n=1 Tax=Nonomuraea sp. CA-143628 TaxID=3239997 RepID=UPI003D939D29